MIERNPANGARPAKAATVLVLRDTGAGIEVLLIRRNAELAFMGGKWVFPGGRLDATDGLPAITAQIAPHVHRQWSGRLCSMEGAALTANETLRYCVAGCRETFEETGVLLARHADGSALEAPLVERLREDRAAVLARPAAFAELLLREELALDLESLVYWAHWITPPGATRRFDTHFFMARMPAGQTARLDPGEATGQTWIAPGAAILAWEAGTMDFAPVTLVMLEDLVNAQRQHGATAALLAGEAAREVPPIMPKLHRDPEGDWVVLPWDAAYASMPGEGVVLKGELPRYLACLTSLRELRPPRHGRDA